MRRKKKRNNNNNNRERVMCVQYVNVCPCVLCEAHTHTLQWLGHSGIYIKTEETKKKAPERKKGILTAVSLSSAK